MKRGVEHVGMDLMRVINPLSIVACSNARYMPTHYLAHVGGKIRRNRSEK